MSTQQKRVKVDIGLTHTNNMLLWPTAESLFNLERKNLGKIITDGNADLASKRNEIARQFLEGKASHLIFIDSDMVFPPNAIGKLLEAETDVIAGLSYLKFPPYAPVIYDKFLNYLMTKWDYPPNLPFEVDVVGCAFMLIKREIFEDLEPPWFSWGDMGFQIGEDVFFCDRIRFELGKRVYVDPRIEIGHVGNKTVTKKDFEEYQEWQNWKKSESGDITDTESAMDLDMRDTSSFQLLTN